MCRALESILVATVNKFAMSNFELVWSLDDLPMWYIHKQFTASFLPMFVLPQSEATIIADDTVIEENLDETFYWMIGLSYQF